MIAVSGGLLFLGYQLMVYGWSQVQGSNAGFFDILWPGRFKGANPDQTGNTYVPGGGLNNTASGGTIGASGTPLQNVLPPGVTAPKP